MWRWLLGILELFGGLAGGFDILSNGPGWDFFFEVPLVYASSTCWWLFFDYCIDEYLMTGWWGGFGSFAHPLVIFFIALHPMIEFPKKVCRFGLPRIAADCLLITGGGLFHWSIESQHCGPAKAGKFSFSVKSRNCTGQRFGTAHR